MVSLLDPTNKIFKSIMNIISTGLVGLKVPPGEYPCEETAECVYKAVQILMQVAEKSVLMINLAKNCDSAPSITSFDKVQAGFSEIAYCGQKSSFCVKTGHLMSFLGQNL